MKTNYLLKYSLAWLYLKIFDSVISNLFIGLLGGVIINMLTGDEVIKYWVVIFLISVALALNVYIYNKNEKIRPFYKDTLGDIAVVKHIFKTKFQKGVLLTYTLVVTIYIASIFVGGFLYVDAKLKEKSLVVGSDLVRINAVLHHRIDSLQKKLNVIESLKPLQNSGISPVARDKQGEPVKR
ncbi:hypothetical protein [Pedobacter duraquae]|uniref:Uncharacterized protein n=1 Tax=Pedobacter duraquae TaxID=425511 RepID=A0A4R6IEY3_9SPHI|nr:hypothetical protein [Pedobacter duraquae]TDO20326.1 hypothetical protein CLV32_4086 [Pedobacter duraquae]